MDPLRLGAAALQVLRAGPVHAAEIEDRIRRAGLEVAEGSMYVILRRLEGEGLIERPDYAPGERRPCRLTSYGEARAEWHRVILTRFAEGRIGTEDTDRG